MNFIYKLERKFGRFAIKNLSLVLIICYGIGYAISFIRPELLTYFTLDPYAIVHGQVWRLVSWIIIPPSESNLFFAVMMMLFYFSVGTTLERTWGAFQYNLYLFSGMFFTIIGSFLLMAFCYIFKSDAFANISYEVGNSILYKEEGFFRYASGIFSTYYVNMSIFLAYAATFPDNIVMLMFFIPVKVKVLGIIYGAFIIFDIISAVSMSGYARFVVPFVVGSSMLNFLIFFLTTRKYIRMNRQQRKLHKEFKRAARERHLNEKLGVAKHKCAVCGKTENDGENLVFRYCSKCNGAYEFCQEHLYTHVHK